MRWVNDTFPPRARARWLLMTIRLSISSLTGTDRTLVAVGISRLASMLVAVRAAAPRRRTFSTSPALGFSSLGCLTGTSFDFGLPTTSAVSCGFSVVLRAVESAPGSGSVAVGVGVAAWLGAAVWLG